MSIQTLSALENAAEPYRRAGYVVIFQSGCAVTLRAPAREFSAARFLTWLFLFWPSAVVYLIRLNHERDRVACLRFTTQNQVEASGFTLDLLERDRQRPPLKLLRVTLLLLVLGIVVGLLCLAYVEVSHS